MDACFQMPNQFVIDPKIVPASRERHKAISKLKHKRSCGGNVNQFRSGSAWPLHNDVGYAAGEKLRVFWRHKPPKHFRELQDTLP